MYLLFFMWKDFSIMFNVSKNVTISDNVQPQGKGLSHIYNNLGRALCNIRTWYIKNALMLNPSMIRFIDD